MHLTRRQFLRGMGVASILVIGGGVYRTVDQGVFTTAQGPAFEPWDNWHTQPAEGPLRLVQSAILASNPHNTQPWLFEVAADRIDLYADTARHLGAADPFLREMHIGIGCALENMLLTAAATGYQADVALEPGTLTAPTAAPQPVRVASIRLTPARPVESNLYATIPERHTDRSPYADRTIPADAFPELSALSAQEPDVQVQLYAAGTPRFQTIAAETVQATEMFIADTEMSQASFVWHRSDWNEIQRLKDGIAIDTSGSPPAIRALVKLLPPLPEQRFNQGWLDGTIAAMDAGAAMGIITVRDLYDRAQTIQAGRVWQRLHLWAAATGLAMQPINQMPELVDRDRQLGRTSNMARVQATLLDDPARQLTFIFRMGYPLNQTFPSARRPVAEVVR
ncbi:MAG: Acg family FMN-binding oxidoreductase [Chloroflexaceae bacterium]